MDEEREGLHRAEVPETDPFIGKSVDDLMEAILPIIPFATFDTDNQGQILIYTDLIEDGGRLRQFDVDDLDIEEDYDR